MEAKGSGGGNEWRSGGVREWRSEGVEELGSKEWNSEIVEASRSGRKGQWRSE